MFKSEPVTRKGTQTRETILDTALDLFHRQGFTDTTMRDVARVAGVPLGAAYYYFPSKDAIVHAFFERVQEDHRARVREAIGAKRLDLRERLRLAFHAKLDVVGPQRRLLGALLRFAGDPEHPLSVFGSATRDSRRHSLATFAATIEGESLPGEIAAMLPATMWTLHLAILLFFVHDRSPQQQRTRQLADTTADLVAGAVRLGRLPIVRPMRRRLAALLGDFGLIEAV